MCGKKKSSESAESIYQRTKDDTPLNPLADLNTDIGGDTYAPSRSQSLRNVAKPMGGRARSLLMPYGIN